MALNELIKNLCENEVVTKLICQAIGSFIVPVVSHVVTEQFDLIKEDKIKYSHISDFWEKYKLSDEGAQVTIEGSLSKYAPMLIGPPKAKREVHRAYRRAIPEEDYQNIKTTIDANLAFTAGQMAWRFDIEGSDLVYLGLYHSIIRNSIPVFIKKDYYYDKVDKLFSKARSSHVIEAKITGKLVEMPSSFLDQFINENNLGSIIKPKIVESGKRNLALMVGSRNTNVKFSGDSRYLDGDIWVAVDVKGKQFFVSRFLDIADPDDLYQESQKLKSDIEEYLPDGNIIFQFDQVEKIVGGYQAITIDELIKEFLKLD